MSPTGASGHAAPVVRASRADRTWRTHDHCPSACHRIHLRLCGAGLGGARAASLVARTGEFDDRLSRDVALLWGGKHVQVAPQARLERPTTVTERIQERDDAGPSAHSRRLPAVGRASRCCRSTPAAWRWRSTSTSGRRGCCGTTPTPCGSGQLARAQPRRRAPARDCQVHVPFRRTPSTTGSSSPPAASDQQRVTDLSRGVDAVVDVPAGADVPIEIAYRSRGLGDWTYAFAREGVTRGAGLQARDEDRLRGHRLPCRHDVANGKETGTAPAGCSPGSSTAW